MTLGFLTEVRMKPLVRKHQINCVRLVLRDVNESGSQRDVKVAATGELILHLALNRLSRLFTRWSDNIFFGELVLSWGV